MKITIPLNSILAESKTYLTSSLASSSTAVTALNTSNFAVNDFVLVGRIGEEYTEIRSISAIGGITSLTFSSSTSFDHPTNTLIQKIEFNQLIIERSTDNVSFSAIKTYSITGDEESYEYNDSSGTSAHYYKVRFFNSQSSTYSDYSNSFTLASPNPADLLFNDIKSKLQLAGDNLISDEAILSSMADGVVKIQMEIVRVNPDYLNTSADIDLVQDQREYDIASTVVSINLVEMKQTDGTYIPLKRTNRRDRTSDADYGGAMSYYTYRDTTGTQKIGLTDIPEEALVDGIRLHYTSQPVRITAITDIIRIPYMMMFLHVLKAFVLSELYRHFKDRQDLSSQLKAEYNQDLMDAVMILNDSDSSDSESTISPALADIYFG